MSYQRQVNPTLQEWDSKGGETLEGRRGRSGGESDSGTIFVAFGGILWGATRLVAKRVPEAVIKKEGRWSSDAVMVYFRV